MSTVKLLATTCALAAAAFTDAVPTLQAQPLRMYSEFRRVGPNNQIIRQDSTGDPREIISPAVLRGMHVSYRIVVATPPGMNYWMYIGANPEELIESTIYREHTVAGIPTSLEQVKLPVNGKLPEAGSPQAPRQADTYWVDLFIPRTTPARRIRFEAQLNFDNRWVIYPLEVRVMEGELAEAQPEDATLAAPRPATNTADPARAAFQRVLCPPPSNAKPAQKPASPAPAPVNMPSQDAFLLRNAQQDLALVRSAEARRGHDFVIKGLIEALADSDAPKPADAKSFCAPFRKPYNPEIILRARDFLIRAATPPND